jgi:hypothetical protein
VSNCDVGGGERFAHRRLILSRFIWCPEAHLAALAVESDDPRVWTTLEKVAKRSPVGLRMEVLSLFGNPRHRSERLRLLASFLDDAQIRDTASDSRFDGPNAGDSYDRIEVRNFVALQLASLLGIKVELKPDPTPGEWATVRETVRGSLELELDKTK